MGLFAAAFTILVWGITFVNTRALLQAGFSALEIQILRFALAYAALWVVHPRRVRLPFAKELPFIGMGLTGVAVYQFLENSAIHYTTASNVAILVACAPIAAALLNRFFGTRTRLSPWFFVGFPIAMAGVAMVSFAGIHRFHFDPVGDLMALGAMVSWGFYSILVARVNETGLSQLFVIRRSFFWALVLLLPFAVYGATPTGGAVLRGSFQTTFDAAVNAHRFASALNWINLGFLGLFASAACFVLWNIACKRLGIVRCSVGLYLIPAVTVLFAWFFLGETLTPSAIAGTGLILLGVFLSEKRAKG